MKLRLLFYAFWSASAIFAEPLFDGKTLQGWTCDPVNLAPHWKAEEGLIVGENGDRQGSILWTKTRFKDFELTLEFRTPSPDYDSGVFLRSETHQVQIGVSRSLKEDLTACIYAPVDGDGPYPAKSDKVKAIHKLSEWNTLRIVAEGQRIKTWLNGEEFVDYVAKKWDAEGPIGLQLHAGVHQKMEFRNIVLKALGGNCDDR